MKLKQVLFHLMQSFLASDSDARKKHRDFVGLLLNQNTSPMAFMNFTIHHHNPDSARFLIEEIFLERHYAIPLTSEKPLIIDCGSNIGLSCLFFKSQYPAAKIICFEPNPHAFFFLQKNISENRLSEVTSIEKAVGGTNHPVSFFIDDEHPTSLANSTFSKRKSHRGTAEVAGRNIAVEQVTLSSFIGDIVDLVKIDIEGAEYDTLLELEQSGAIKRVKHFLIEYHFNIGEKYSLEDFIAILTRNHFLVSVLSKKGLDPANPEPQDILIHAKRA